MRTLAIDSNGNLVIENNTFKIIFGGDSLLQRLSIKLQMIYGEWFLDVTRGIKYFEYIFVKEPDLTIVESLFKSAILEETEITTLLSFDIAYYSDTRRLEVTFSVDTVYGVLASTVGGN